MRKFTFAPTDLRGVNFEGVGEIKFAQELLLLFQRGVCSLDVKSWHTCDTVHCIAGWACPEEEFPAAKASRMYPTLARYFYCLSNDTAMDALSKVATGKLSVFPY